ncbi:hypothetical protein [Chromobacterium amazonense]|uniref:hypothetical protein n=1 Tax=Chromobacterium amazonense TaxID=1382803 RepID=UPI00111354B1|nr:hypothetical protein [Chromobacterium amazonense]
MAFLIGIEWLFMSGTILFQPEEMLSKWSLRCLTAGFFVYKPSGFEAHRRVGAKPIHALRAFVLIGFPGGISEPE